VKQTEESCHGVLDAEIYIHYVGKLETTAPTAFN
jgi:hypothetical protein